MATFTYTYVCCISHVHIRGEPSSYVVHSTYVRTYARIVGGMRCYYANNMDGPARRVDTSVCNVTEAELQQPMPEGKRRKEKRRKLISFKAMSRLLLLCVGTFNGAIYQGWVITES